MTAMLARAAFPLAAAAAILTSIARPTGAADGRPEACTPSDTAAACGKCHVAIHDEWRESRHAMAWTNPTYVRELRGLQKPERCHGCHAPQPVLARLGRPPRARADGHAEGVTCRTCHDSRGRIAGPFGAPTEAHESQEHPAFTEDGSIHLCASCHDMRIGPVLPLARDFHDAKLAERGKSCVGCHMPRVRRPIAQYPDSGRPAPESRAGRSHALKGPADPEFCAQAFKIGIARDGDRIELSVGNRAGHRVPGLTTRRFVVEVGQRDARGKTQRWDRITLSAENPLRAAETRRFRFPLAPGAAVADVVILHEHGDRSVEIARDEHEL